MSTMNQFTLQAAPALAALATWLFISPLTSFLLNNNSLAGSITALTLAAFVFHATQIHTHAQLKQILGPRTKHYRLSYRETMVEIIKFLEFNPVPEPVHGIPRKWQINADPDTGHIIAELSFQEKFGIDLNAGPIRSREKHLPRHIDLQILVKPSDESGTSVQLIWNTVSPQGNHFVNSIIHKYSNWLDEALQEKISKNLRQSA